MYVLNKKVKNIKTFLVKFSFLQLNKNLYTAWACFRNDLGPISAQQYLYGMKYNNSDKLYFRLQMVNAFMPDF